MSDSRELSADEVAGIERGVFLAIMLREGRVRISAAELADLQRRKVTLRMREETDTGALIAEVTSIPAQQADECPQCGNTRHITKTMNVPGMGQVQSRQPCPTCRQGS